MSYDRLSNSRPTLADVARRVGVSKSAVSQAMNWEPGRVTTVKLETREKILRTVQEMGYRPSWRGRMLVKRRTQTIAVVNAATLGVIPRGVYWEIVNHIEAQLSKFEYCPTFFHVKDHEDRFERILGDARFDGCLSLGLFAPKVLDILRRNEVPTVLINADAGSMWTCVNVDDESGTRAVMRHLMTLGHKNIAYNGGENPPALRVPRFAQPPIKNACSKQALSLINPLLGRSISSWSE